MEIISITPTVKELKQTGNFGRGRVKDGESPTFRLLPAHPISKSIFAISTNILIFVKEIKFSLDITVNTIVKFDAGGKIPTTKQLYELYTKAKEEDGKILWRRLVENSTPIDRKYKLISIDKIENLLKRAIEDAYPVN